MPFAHEKMVNAKNKLENKINYWKNPILMCKCTRAFIVNVFILFKSKKK